MMKALTATIVVVLGLTAPAEAKFDKGTQSRFGRKAINAAVKTGQVVVNTASGVGVSLLAQHIAARYGVKIHPVFFTALAIATNDGVKTITRKVFKNQLAKLETNKPFELGIGHKIANVAFASIFGVHLDPSVVNDLVIGQWMGKLGAGLVEGVRERARRGSRTDNDLQSARYNFEKLDKLIRKAEMEIAHQAFDTKVIKLASTPALPGPDPSSPQITGTAGR